jgi:NAD(P)-dependent dehydrogenase (short-subunit alcohol dehydrogenase family)
MRGARLQPGLSRNVSTGVISTRSRGLQIDPGLTGEVVIATGAARGIGRATVELLAAAGAHVLAVDLAEEVRDVVAGLPGEGHRALVRDLADHDVHAEIVGAASAMGPLRGIAHMAGVLRRRPSVAEVSEDDWDFQHDVNLKAAFFLCRAVGSALQEAGRGGRIVAFSSQGWWSGGFGGSVAYAASKGGVVSFVRGLARTYGADGITVNAVAPGAIDTPMMTGELSPEALKAQVDAVPLGRMGDPSEVAGPVLFLLSDQASYVSGATLNVSGAWLMY